MADCPTRVPLLPHYWLKQLQSCVSVVRALLCTWVKRLRIAVFVVLQLPLVCAVDHGAFFLTNRFLGENSLVSLRKLRRTLTYKIELILRSKHLSNLDRISQCYLPSGISRMHLYVEKFNSTISIHVKKKLQVHTSSQKPLY